MITENLPAHVDIDKRPITKIIIDAIQTEIAELETELNNVIDDVDIGNSNIFSLIQYAQELQTRYEGQSLKTFRDLVIIETRVRTAKNTLKAFDRELGNLVGVVVVNAQDYLYSVNNIVLDNTFYLDNEYYLDNLGYESGVIVNARVDFSTFDVSLFKRLAEKLVAGGIGVIYNITQEQ